MPAIANGEGGDWGLPAAARKAASTAAASGLLGGGSRALVLTLTPSSLGAAVLAPATVRSAPSSQAAARAAWGVCHVPWEPQPVLTLRRVSVQAPHEASAPKLCERQLCRRQLCGEGERAGGAVLLEARPRYQPA